MPMSTKQPKSHSKKPSGWRRVDVADDALRFASVGGFLSLEELDGDADSAISWMAAKTVTPAVVEDEAPPSAEAATADEPAAKPAKKRKRKKSKASAEPDDSASAAKRQATAATEGQDASEHAASEAAVASLEGAEASPAADVDMSAWAPLGLHHELVARLAARGFVRPTPIQAACLPPALHGRRDIVGAAETGSGKTLAFGLPILHSWLEARDAGEAAARQDLFALIITPTRELALQARRASRAPASHAPALLWPGRVRASPPPADPFGVGCASQVAEHLRALLPPPGRVVTLVGGMAVVKQKRLLQARPEVVVATPGRLWELMSADAQPYLRTLPRLRFFVLDEVDRPPCLARSRPLSPALACSRPPVPRSRTTSYGTPRSDGLPRWTGWWMRATSRSLTTCCSCCRPPAAPTRRPRARARAATTATRVGPAPPVARRRASGGRRSSSPRR